MIKAIAPSGGRASARAIAAGWKPKMIKMIIARTPPLIILVIGTLAGGKAVPSAEFRIES